MSNIAKHIVFTGRVQGVGFRFTARSIAKRCELTGMVRNLPDGSVEMLAQGHPDDISDCIRDLKETFGANIRDTKINEVPYNPQYSDFRISY